MRMKKEHYRRLWDMSAVNGRSLRMELIIARRICREVLAELAFFKGHYRQKIAEYTKGLPFTARRLEDVKSAFLDYEDGQVAILHSIGKWLANLHDRTVAELPFEQVAAIYAVNRVHWDEARTEYEQRGLFGLLFVGKYEDSSLYLALADKTGFFDEMGPTVTAVQRYMLKWMAENTEKLPDPFAPGAPLHGMATYTQQPDGSMQRNAPDLVVHNSDGSSAVISRKDGK